MIFERSTEAVLRFLVLKIKKSAQISTTIKVSSTFSKVAGFQRAEPFGRCPQTAKSPLYKKNGARGEKYESISRKGVLKLASTDRTPLLTVRTY